MKFQIYLWCIKNISFSLVLFLLGLFPISALPQTTDSRSTVHRLNHSQSATFSLMTNSRDTMALAFKDLKGVMNVVMSEILSLIYRHHFGPEYDRVVVPKLDFNLLMTWNYIRHGQQYYDASYIIHRRRELLYGQCVVVISPQVELGWERDEHHARYRYEILDCQPHKDFLPKAVPANFSDPWGYVVDSGEIHISYAPIVEMEYSGEYEKKWLKTVTVTSNITELTQKQIILKQDIPLEENKFCGAFLASSFCIRNSLSANMQRNVREETQPPTDPSNPFHHVPNEEDDYIAFLEWRDQNIRPFYSKFPAWWLSESSKFPAWLQSESFAQGFHDFNDNFFDTGIPYSDKESFRNPIEYKSTMEEYVTQRQVAYDETQEHLDVIMSRVLSLIERQAVNSEYDRVMVDQVTPTKYAQKLFLGRKHYNVHYTAYRDGQLEYGDCLTQVSYQHQPDGSYYQLRYVIKHCTSDKLFPKAFPSEFVELDDVVDSGYIYISYQERPQNSQQDKRVRKTITVSSDVTLQAQREIIIYREVPLGSDNLITKSLTSGERLWNALPDGPDINWSLPLPDINVDWEYWRNWEFLPDFKWPWPSDEDSNSDSEL